jgi:DNA-binding protein H-NS
MPGPRTMRSRTAQRRDRHLRAGLPAGEALLKKRAEQRRKEAIASARITLAGVNLTFRDVVNEPSGPKAAQTPLPAGQRDVNPANSKQVWVSGRGRRPSWFKAVEKKGQVPQILPQKKASLAVRPRARGRGCDPVPRCRPLAAAVRNCEFSS